MITHRCLEQKGTGDVDTDRPHEARRAKDQCWHDDRLDENSKNTVVSLKHRRKVTLVVPDLPNPHESEPTRTALRLLRKIPSIPSLVQEEHNEHQVQNADGEHHPEDVAPTLRSSEHEIAKQWTPIRRRKKQPSPKADLARMLVEVEHVLDK